MYTFSYHTRVENHLETCDHLGVILLHTAVRAQSTSTWTWAIFKVCNEYFILQDGQKLDCLRLQALKSNARVKTGLTLKGGNEM